MNFTQITRHRFPSRNFWGDPGLPRLKLTKQHGNSGVLNSGREENAGVIGFQFTLSSPAQMCVACRVFLCHKNRSQPRWKKKIALQSRHVASIQSATLAYRAGLLEARDVGVMTAGGEWAWWETQPASAAVQRAGVQITPSWKRSEWLVERPENQHTWILFISRHVLKIFLRHQEKLKNALEHRINYRQTINMLTS